MLEGIIVCNSLLRPELPAADVSNNSECCGLTQTHTEMCYQLFEGCQDQKRKREKEERTAASLHY